MYVTGYAWTKSRFLGLSLGVHFIGKGQCHPTPLHILTPLPSHTNTPSFTHTPPPFTCAHTHYTHILTLYPHTHTPPFTHTHNTHCSSPPFTGLWGGIHSNPAQCLCKVSTLSILDCCVAAIDSSPSHRSILTYPWMEMGGKCHLECAQTGYAADLEFHCKVHALPPEISIHTLELPQPYLITHNYRSQCRYDLKPHPLNQSSKFSHFISAWYTTEGIPINHTQIAHLLNTAILWWQETPSHC